MKLTAKHIRTIWNQVRQARAWFADPETLALLADACRDISHAVHERFYGHTWTRGATAVHSRMCFTAALLDDMAEHGYFRPVSERFDIPR